MDIKYEWFIGSLVQEELLQECSLLYSDHYGCWHPKTEDEPPRRIRLSVSRIKEYLNSAKSSIYLARHNGVLVGYAIAISDKIQDYGIVTWVTQLVVHFDYRKNDIAKTLLYSFWGLTDHYAWGIVSANPYAIRALEKATRRRCNPQRIYRNHKKLKSIGIENVPYVKNKTSLIVDKIKMISKIDTEFAISLKDLDHMTNNVTTSEVPWVLGKLDVGWEWFAFTFKDQEKISLSADEIRKMVAASGQVAMMAYARMKQDEGHGWMKHTDKEVEAIIDYCKLETGQSVIDMGCGVGRHSIGLARRGLVVRGIDNVQSNIDKAISNSRGSEGLTFLKEDCRNATLTKADAVICLYDVVGSYIAIEDNQAILRGLFNNVKTNGYVLLSVMNYVLTVSRAIHKFNFQIEPNKLLELPASRIMEITGNVFDPNFYLVDESTQIVYRREQFLSGRELPMEAIVSDRRFTESEIKGMCVRAGFQVVWTRCVKAGNWGNSLEPNHASAKEILILCQRP